jgi:hypothetical protein
MTQPIGRMISVSTLVPAFARGYLLRKNRVTVAFVTSRFRGVVSNPS